MDMSPQVELINRRVVAVDGGAATGKGRLMDELSQLLRLKGIPVLHISTGSIFRAVAWCAMQHAQTRVKDKSKKTDAEVVAETLQLVRAMPAETYLRLAAQHHMELHSGLVWLDGAPASIEVQIKGPGVGVGSSIVSVPIPVRHLMEELVRRQINEFDGYVLIDGRDITNGVVPDAALRILMTVAPNIAAQRSPEHTIDELIARDESDRAKPYGALRHPDDPGEGVIVLPTDNHTPESVRDHVYALMRRTFPELPEI
jgi:cytidylate kinase